MIKKTIKYLSALALVLFAILVSSCNKYEDSFTCSKYASFQYQASYSRACSGFSSSYVLRAYGNNISWETIYNENPYVDSNGACRPENLKKRLDDLGFSTKRKYGIDNMKADICKDQLVIYFIKLPGIKDDFHYIVVSGYDEENFYTVDSLFKYTSKNNITETYNRIIAKDEFIKIGENDYYRNYQYLLIKA